MKRWLVVVAGLFTATGALRSQDLKALLDEASNARDPRIWAEDLIRADKAAERLESRQPSGCCGYWCIRIDGFELHYRFNGITGQENYQHDLLQLVARTHEGTPEGAAFAALISDGCQTIGNVWDPYFKTLIDILGREKWKRLHDPRLIRIRAEAYETWWSLSMASSIEPVLHDQALDPGDFVEGASRARVLAISAYRELLRLGKLDRSGIEHLRDLEARKDTKQRRWICYGD